jgi:hypothetical protein
MDYEPKERLRRARAHLRAAKRYAAEGNAAKARAHFGRAEHYYGSEFGGLTDMHGTRKMALGSRGSDER